MHRLLTCVQTQIQEKETKIRRKRRRDHAHILIRMNSRLRYSRATAPRPPATTVTVTGRKTLISKKKKSNSKTKFSKASKIPLKRESNDSIEILSEEDSVSAVKAPQKGDEFPTLVDAQRFLDKFSAPMHFKFVIETGPHPNRGPNKDMIYRM